LCIVPAHIGAADRLCQIVCAGESRQLTRGVLATVIGMKDHPFGALTAHGHRHRQCGLDEVGVHVLGDRPADHSP